MESRELSHRSKVLFSIFLVIIIISILILSAEGLIRVRQYVKYGFAASFEDIYEVDKVTGLRVLIPLTETKNLSINSLGFRGPELQDSRGAEVVRIAFLGASTTYCAEVSSDAMAWPHLVTEELAESYPQVEFDYVNGAVPGYGIDATRKNFKHRISPLHPDAVVVYHGTNDLGGELRDLAQAQGIEELNLAKESSWLSKYSLLWNLVEKNLAILSSQNVASGTKIPFQLEPEKIGNTFRERLLALIAEIRETGIEVIAIATFASQLREAMSDSQLAEAGQSAAYYAPFATPRQLISGFNRYNQIIKQVAQETGIILIDDADFIPGDRKHFADSVHFTDEGSLLQASRVASKLKRSPAFLKLVTATTAAGSRQPRFSSNVTHREGQYTGI